MNQRIHRPTTNPVKLPDISILKTAVRSLFLFVAILLAGSSARATHFRYGLVTAYRVSETIGTVTYRLDVSLSWRLGTAPPAVPFTISGGNTGSLSVPLVNVTDPSGNWQNSTGSANVTLNKTSTLTRVEFTGFTKLTTTVNNTAGNWDVYVILNTAAPGNTPVSSLPAIINVPSGESATTFMIPASDPDPGSTLTFGYPNLTSGPLAGETEPAGFSVNPTTGRCSFNTIGKNPGDQYNALITVTDNDGNQIELDFLINIVSPSAPPSFDYSVTPVNGAVYNVVIGNTLTFPIAAVNAGSGTTVSLSASGLNSYITTANFLPALPATGNPSSTTFTYTPTTPEIGSTYILNIIAANNLMIQAATSVIINVVSQPAPAYIGSTPGNGTIMAVRGGMAHSDTITAQSPIGSNVSIASATIPSGATLSPGIPTPGANPGRAVMTWNPAPADFGKHVLTVQSKISSAPTITSTLSYALIADDLPVFASSPATTTAACSAYTYNIVATDANIPYGDTVEINPAAPLPSWLTLTATGNGTATLSGTPVNADAGAYTISLVAEDLYHHNYAPVLQTYTLTVSPNVITGMADVCAGNTITLTGATPGGTWGSDNITVAAVSAGIVTGVSAGAATISYNAGTGCIATASITVLPVFTITASAGAHGVISPAGSSNICEGDNASYTITASPGYHISDVLVDGSSVGATSSYIFTSVNASSSISAFFAADCIAPAISVCPGNIMVSNNTGTCGATVTYPAATVTGTSPVVTYSQNSGTAFPVGTTTISVTATNSCGTDACSFTATVNDTQLPVITAPAPVTITSCVPAAVSLGTPVTSDNCGVATVTNDAPSLFPVGATTVTWTVTDIHGNHASAAQAVTVKPSVITVAAATGSVSCYGGSNGSIATTVSGGAVPYSYSWSTGATTANISGKAAGSYSVKVTDANNCTATASYTISQPSAITISASVTDAACNGGNGTITAAVSGGTKPYTYLWSNTATTANITAAAATYTITATDAAGCSQSGAYTIAQPAAIVITGVATDVSCSGGSNGSISTIVSGGKSPYSYTWSNGSTSANPASLAAAAYSVTVTDGNKCSNKGSFTVSQPAPLAITAAVTNIGCSGSTKGSITTTVTGGTSAYNYSWSNGATTANLTGLSAGTYSVTVTDAHSCVTKASYTVIKTSSTLSLGGITVTPKYAVTGMAAYTIFKGYGPQSVKLAATVSGGTGSYNYSWTPAPDCSSPASSSTSVNPAVNTTYKVTVTDASGCSVVGTQAINLIETRCDNGGDDDRDKTIGDGSNNNGPNNNVAVACSIGGNDKGSTNPSNPGVAAATKANVNNGDNGDNGKSHKVCVCHKGHTLSIDTAAVPAHLAHGDYLGSCPDEHDASRTSNPVTGNDPEPEPTVESDIIKVYPNPNDGIFSVEIPVMYKDATITVTNIAGKLVDTRVVNDNTGTPVDIHLTNIAKGIYFVNVHAGDKTFMKKLVIR
jgi:hypothetical protein